ncbi:MAG: homocysteine S-methyltransferase family protein [Pseudomonadota bacterium]
MTRKRYQRFVERIELGDSILIDGATGTEVEIRGVPQLENAWNGGAALSHPEILKQVHLDYLNHGAELIISNTFGTALHALIDSGVGDDFEALNRRGVEIAIEAREQAGKPDVLVAGGVTHWSWNGRHPALDELKSSATEQAQIMADAGADLIMLEMMVYIDKMVALIEAGQACDLPVWVGLTLEIHDDGSIRLPGRGERLEEAIDSIRSYNVPLVSVMHTEVDDVDACLAELKNHWTGPIGVYAHSTRFHDQRTVVRNTTISPESYAEASQRWLRAGVQVIGGCCGVGVPHIKTLSEQMAASRRPSQ